MKTFVRLIRRYVLAAVGIVLLLFSGVAVLGWLGWQELPPARSWIPVRWCWTMWET